MVGEESETPLYPNPFVPHGGRVSLLAFQNWYSSDFDSMGTFGMGLMELPQWLYLDLIMFLNGLIWHRKDVKGKMADRSKADENPFLETRQ